MLIRKKIKKFVNKMGYPSYVKMIGMTESKKLLLRKTLLLDTPSSSNNSKTNAFQILLNPLECPNISKIFKTLSFKVKDNEGKDKDQTFGRIFKYDYIRIKSIFISIKPAQNVSINSGNQTGTDLYTGYGDSPISNVYAYFTYKYPMLSPNDITATIENMYGTNPNIDRIVQEGKLKNTYSWPSNKSMTISINKLMYRVNSEPFKLCTNGPFDLQYLNKLCTSTEGIYDPFEYSNDVDLPTQDNDNVSEDNNNQLGTTYNDPIYEHEISVPDLQTLSLS